MGIVTRSKLRIAASLVGLSLFATASAQVTQRVSVSTAGSEANGGSGYYFLSISADGRYQVFPSSATNLVVGDTNGVVDIFVRDRLTGSTERVSVDSAGAQANGNSLTPSISGDGRYVGFTSDASNLVPADTYHLSDVFVHDRLTGTTERVSVDSAGAQANGDSLTPSISADGRYVAFTSGASNLVVGDTNGFIDIFLRDRLTGTIERVSVDSAGAQGNDRSSDPCISADGRYVTFVSYASNLVPGDTNHLVDIFVRDRQTGATERVNVASTGAEANNGSQYASISADGRYVAFASFASNLVPGDTNFAHDIFVRDRQSGTTERVSVDSAGVQGNGSSGYNSPPSISTTDGRYVAFESDSWNLVSGDTNNRLDVFVHDRQTRITERVSVDSFGMQGNGYSYSPSISADGRYVCIRSEANNLVPRDTNGVYDVFVHDRIGSPDFASLCDPGIGGVIPCPCANAPSGSGRGCDNSAATGGASLSASGGSYLSSDSLVFTTTGEGPTALSIVTQWSGTNATGQVFGMGVRCTSGTLKRLYTKIAAGGSITAPDFGGGDPQVSVRSAALGDSILPGLRRWYLVYYRDSNVLGGCPASSTFNATQTGQVTWSQ